MPRKPEAQIVHEETDTLPLVDVKIPGGQDVQLDAPALAYDPAGQTVQLDAPALAYDPAGQTVQPAALTVPEFITVPA